MFELKQISEKTYYINYPTQIGIHLVSENEAVLIDSGNDARAGKLVLKTLQKNGWSLKAVYNTHCHADHVGGNAFLQKETGCKTFVPEVDRAAVCNTFLNQMLLAGSYPVKDLDHKLFLAESSNALTLTEKELPSGFKMFPLKGHTMGMVGFLTPDGVAFIADSVVSGVTIEKYFVTYLISPKDYLETLDKLEQMSAKIFLPSHVTPCEDIKPVVEENRKSVQHIIGIIKEYCKVPRLTDDIIKHIFTVGGVRFSVAQYFMVGSTVRSYLAYLEREGELAVICDDNMLYWQSV